MFDSSVPELVGVKGWKRFLFYGTYSAKEARRSLCSYLIGLLSCFVVIVATGVVDVVINNFPMIFVQLTNNAGYFMDADITSRQLSNVPNVLRSQPFLNYTRLTDLLESNSGDWKTGETPPLKFIESRDFWNPLLIPVVEISNAIGFNGCNFDTADNVNLILRPTPTLHEQSLSTVCKVYNSMYISLIPLYLSEEAGRLGSKFPKNFKPSNLLYNEVILGSTLAEALQLNEGDEFPLAFNLDQHLQSIATHLYLQSLIPGANGWGTSGGEGGAISRSRFDELIAALHDFSEVRLILRVRAIVGDKNGLISNLNLGSEAIMNMDSFDQLLSGGFSTDSVVNGVRNISLDPYLLSSFPEVIPMLKAARAVRRTSSESPFREFATRLQGYFSKDSGRRQATLYRGIQSDVRALQGDLHAWTREVLGNKLGLYLSGEAYLEMINYIVKNFEYTTSLIGMVLNIAIVALLALSVLLVYSLLLISVESSTLKLGILRMIGFPRVRLAELVVCQAMFYVLPALIFGLIALAILAPIVANVLRNLIIGEGVDINAPSPLTGNMILKQIIIGLLIPLISSITPVRTAFKHNIRDSLDVNRAKPGIFQKNAELAKPSSVQVSFPWLVVGILLSIIGFAVYYGIPLALMAGDLIMIALVFLVILIGFVGGLVLLALNLQQPLCGLLAILFLWWESLQTRSLVLTSLVSHQSRNRKTALMYSGCLAGSLFLMSAWDVYANSSAADTLRTMGGDAKIITYDIQTNHHFLDVINDFIVANPNGPIADFAIRSITGQRTFSNNYPSTSYSSLPSIALKSLSGLQSVKTRMTGLSPNYFQVAESASIVLGKGLSGDKAQSQVNKALAGDTSAYFFRLDSSRYSKNEAIEFTSASRLESVASSGESTIPLATALLDGLYTMQGSAESIPSCYALDTILPKLPSWFGARRENSLVLSVQGSSVTKAAGARLKAAGCIKKAAGMKSGSSTGSLSTPTQDTILSTPSLLNVNKAIGLNRLSARSFENFEIIIRRNPKYSTSQLKSVVSSLITTIGQRGALYRSYLNTSGYLQASINYFSDTEDSSSTMANAVTYAFIFLILVLMLLCFFSLTASMGANIADAAKEMAVLRSLGCSKFRVAIVHVYEGFLLVLSSSLLGIVVGLIAGWSMVAQRAMFADTNVEMNVPYMMLIVVFGVSIVAACLSTLIPAYRLLNKHSIASLNKLTA